jgi:hypothetical protein
MVGRPSGLSPSEEADWQIESKEFFIFSYDELLKISTAYRVKWFRARAARDRAREEVEILETEFLRAHRLFLQMSKVWMELAKGEKSNTTYAYKQSTMYEKLAIDCEEAFDKICSRVRPSESTGSSD